MQNLSTNHNLLTASNLCLTINKQKILHNINLTLKSNEIITIIGPNGAGKSSLLKLILGLMKPTSGAVTLKPNLKLGYMPQKLRLNRLMPLSVKRFLSTTPKEYIATLKIEHLLKKEMLDISGGEMQRVLLARALFNNPDILVLDEPTQGIDINGQTEFYTIISELKNQLNCSVIMVSHDLHLVMLGTDVVLCLNKHICCSGTPEKVLQDNEFINLFGSSTRNQLAFYRHHHNHIHQPDGKITDI